MREAKVPQPTIGVIMNGVTGRMGYRQHLVRSILALREEGGVLLADGSRVQVRPLLVGRDESKLVEIAARHDVTDYTTDLDAALASNDWQIYFDAQITSARVSAIRQAISAGKHVYTEKPIAETYEQAMELVALAKSAGIKNGAVHDKLYLPGIRQLKRLIDSGYFGRVLSVRGEFGYWVFEGPTPPAQRPSWNYRAEDGGGIVLDMFPHWNYLLEGLFGRIESVFTTATTHIDSRVAEGGETYSATADDGAYAIFGIEGGIVAQFNSSWAVRVNRKELLELQVDGTHGSAVAGLFGCSTQAKDATPRPVWNPDERDSHQYSGDWTELADDSKPVNAFRAQWEDFLRHVLDDGEHPHDFAAGARGLKLAEDSLESSRTGRRIVRSVQ
jgi:predicted dehydrogenase